MGRKEQLSRTKMKQLILSPDLSLKAPNKESPKKAKASPQIDGAPPAKRPRGRPNKNSKIGGSKQMADKPVAETQLTFTSLKLQGQPKPRVTASPKRKRQENNNNKRSPINNNTILNNNIDNLDKNINNNTDVMSSGMDESDDEMPLPLPDRPSSPKKASFGNSRSKSPSSKGEQQKGGGFNCKVCHKWFPNRYFQRKHMLMDHEDQLYECRVCSFNSVDPEKLKSHIIKLHVTKKEKSETVALENMQGELEKLIDKKVPRKVMMEDGVTLGRDVNSKMRYVCALCSRIYTSKYSLERHVRCHTLEKPYHCDVCPFTSSYREHMMRHMTSVHLIVHSDAPKVKYISKKKRDSDEFSDKGSTSSGSPGKKRRNILRERFECAVCGMRATHKTDLMDHIRGKHPNAHIESLVNNDGSKVHLIVTNAKKAKPSKKLTIQCTFCSLIFHDTWKYKVHLRSHTGVKPFECSICDLRATSKMTIRDHIHRKHNKAENAKIILRTVGIDGTVEKVELPVPWREFRCEHCNEQFADNYNLKMHKTKSHPNVLPFTCTICSHKEKTKANMLIHCSENHPKENCTSMILHNGKTIKIGSLKLPTCDICRKVFPYRSLLTIHTRLHTGEKELSCSHCDYQTNFKGMLAVHIQKKHFGTGKSKKVSHKRKKASATKK